MVSEKEEYLIKKYLEGDDSSLALLIKQNLKPVYNFIYRLADKKEDADDITQETFFKLWKNIKKYREGESFRAWLFSIARNTTIDWMRKKKVFLFSDFEKDEDIFSENIVDIEPLPDEIFEKAENQKMAEELISQLPLKYREVIILRYKEDMTFDEIGKVLNKPIDTVKSQHRRALIALRKLVNAPK